MKAHFDFLQIQIDIKLQKTFQQSLSPLSLFFHKQYLSYSHNFYQLKQGFSNPKQKLHQQMMQLYCISFLNHKIQLINPYQKFYRQSERYLNLYWYRSLKCSIIIESFSVLQQQFNRFTMNNIIESVLVKHLGKYIDGLKNSLDVGIFDGEVTIENVSLKPSFVNSLGLPFTLKFSHIDKIHISIPWSKLKEKNTMVSIRGIYVLLNVSYEQAEDNVDPNQLLKNIIQRIKMQVKRKDEGSGNRQQTFAQKNLIRIVDNAIININNIHIRLQNYQRNWDYSFGVIMDDIESYTVDQNDQKTFYTRHFTHKQKNQPFKKILNIDKLQIYFNDVQKVFIGNYVNKSRAYIIRMLAHPFPKRETAIQSPQKKKVAQDLQPYPPYDIKNLTTIRLSAVGTQQFAEDKRYVIDVSATINSIDITINSRQLSQIFHCIQHFYQYGLNIIKNGKKGYNFDEQTQKYYRMVVSKIAREQKLLPLEQSQLLMILKDVPITVLENVNDEIINTVRFDNQLKKINKMTNIQKRNKNFQELLDKKQKLQAMQGIQIFKKVQIDVKIYRANFKVCDINDISAADFAVVGISIGLHMDLAGQIKLICDIKNVIAYYKDTEITHDHFDIVHSMVKIETQILKKQLVYLHIMVLKKELLIKDDLICSIIDWISMIRLKSALLNYIDQFLNYSIDITRIMMYFLCEKQRKITFDIAIPIIKLSIAKNDVIVNFGRLKGTKKEGQTTFSLQFSQKISALSDSVELVSIHPGSLIQMKAKTDKISHQQIVISLCDLNVKNAQHLIKIAHDLLHSDIYNKTIELKLADNSMDEILQGQFFLNHIKQTLNAKIKQSSLIFYSPTIQQFPQQKISLVRTRIYRLRKQDRFFIVFKQQVNKQINIVQAKNMKAMQTIFLKLKDYIQQVSTAFQWQKYYRQIYQDDIVTLESIQDIGLKNDIMMTLSVRLSMIDVKMSEDASLQVNGLETSIIYNQFNTEAMIGLTGFDLQINKQKVISDLRFKGSYSSLQSKIINFQIDKLGYHVGLFSTFSKIIAISSQYQLFILNLRANIKKTVVYQIQQDQSRLSLIKTQSTKADNINKFLLQFRASVEMNNLDGQILGYRNKIQSMNFIIEKNRNQYHPSLQAEIKEIILFSMIKLPYILIRINTGQMAVECDSINSEIDLQTILYEVVKGEGSLIIKEVIKFIKNSKIAKNQYKIEQLKISKISNNAQPTKKVINGRIGNIRLEIKITAGLNIGVSMKDLELQNGRFSWNQTLFWLNSQSISLIQNNGILKWGQSNIDLCMTNFKIKFNGKQILYLIHQLKKIQQFLSINKFDAVAFVETEMHNPDQKGRVAVYAHKQFSMRIQEIEIVYQCGDKNPLLSIRQRPLYLTNESNFNSINIAVWHMNRSLKLYQPILEPLQIKIIDKENNKQFQLFFEEIYLIVSQECIIDCLNQVKLLKNIYAELAKDEGNQIEEIGQKEITLAKQSMLEEEFQYYQAPDFNQRIEYSSVLKIANKLGSSAIVQVTCGTKQKQRLLFDLQQNGIPETKTIFIPQKTSYNYSYQLIQRYQKIKLKICIMNECYSARPILVSFLLYDRDNHYIKPVTFIDSNGIQIESQLAVKVSYSQGVYLIDIIGKYAISNLVNASLYFRYSDAQTINKSLLQGNQQLLLPPWIVDCVTFGTKEELSCDNILRLRPDQNEEECGGHFVLKISTGNNGKIQFIIHKEPITEYAKEIPKLRYLHNKQQEQKQQAKGKHNEQSKQKMVNSQKHKQPQIFNYKILPGILLINHLNFPILVNNKTFQTNAIDEIDYLTLQDDKQFVNLSLGDKSNHDIFIPEINNPLQLNLKLTGDNYVTIIIHTRRNKLKQRIIHIYSQIHLIINLPNLYQPSLITNIYQHKFIVKKEVKNDYKDRPHPNPVLKDRFFFNSSHYLLSLQEKYLSMKINGCTSNDFILFHSDFDKDIQMISDLSSQLSAIHAISYECKAIILQTDQQQRKAQILQCFYTYIMPKYYLINRSQQVFVINGSHLLRTGQKITVDYIKYLDINIRDQLEFKHLYKHLEESSSIIFLKGTETFSSQDLNKYVQKVQEQNNLSIIAEVSERQTTNNLTQQIQKMQPLIKQIEQTSKRHIVFMENIRIFAVSKRICDYNTIGYEINNWYQWLNVENKLSHTIVLSIEFADNIIGIQSVLPGHIGKIIAGVSPTVKIAVLYEDEEIILGNFEMDNRLNHVLFLNQCQYEEINIKQTKIKIGRHITVSSPKKEKQDNIQKVQHSLSLKIGKIRISFIFNEEKMRKQLIRFSLLDLSLLAMRYKNGLYMFHLQFGSLTGIYRRTAFLVLKLFNGYLQGVQGQFLQRLNIDLGQQLQITLTDQLIVSLIKQVQTLEKYLPIKQKSSSEQISSQQQQTFHLNSLGIKGVQINLCLRKKISNMEDNNIQLLSKMGLSFVEVEDAHIHLSPIEISTPLKQKHINGISKMYTMESFVGIASGLNILGNPAQFANQFQAGRNRGGIVPFFGSIFAGTSNSLSKIIGTIGSGMSQLTFDREFMKHRIDNKNIKPENFMMGLKLGMRELGHSLKSSLTGVVQQPMQGLRQQGSIGAVKGAFAGLTGLVTKPIIGLIFAATKAIEGVNSSISYLDYRRLEREQLITRPLYHKFKLIRPYKNEDELAYNILINWWDYSDVELVGGYLLQSEEGDSIIDILIVTCSELILIDLETKQVKLKLKMEQLLATGKFTQGVVLYYQSGQSEQDQDQIVFRLQNDPNSRDNLYWTLKGFIGLYAQKEK